MCTRCQVVRPVRYRDTHDTCAVSRYFLLLRYTAVVSSRKYRRYLRLVSTISIVVSWVSHNTTLQWRRYVVVLGDTDDISIYRDTKISRYWYRACLDTFWYRDTKYRDTFRYFLLILHVAKPYNTLTVSVTHSSM